MYEKPITTDEGTDLTRTFVIIWTCIQTSFSPNFLSLFHYHTIKGFGTFINWNRHDTLEFQIETIFKVMAFTYCVVRNKRRSFLLISLFTMNCISCRSRNSRCHSSIKVSTCDRIGAESNNKTYVIITEHR